MVIKNISDKDINFNFEFETYSFPKNKMWNVSNQKLVDFLQERWPSAFSFDIEVKKDVPEIKHIPAKSFIKRQDQEVDYDATMQPSSGREEVTFGAVDQTPPSGSTDSDGVSWVGEGLVIEGK